jgi:hypothetical protein
MINKFIDTPDDAVADIHDGATVLISGFGGATLLRHSCRPSARRAFNSR